MLHPLSKESDKKIESLYEEAIKEIDGEIYTLRKYAFFTREQWRGRIVKIFHYERWYFYEKDGVWKRIIFSGVMDEEALWTCTYIPFYIFTFNPKLLDTNDTNSIGDES